MRNEIQNFVESIGAIDVKPEHKIIFNRPNYFRFKGELQKDALLIIKISRILKPFYGVDKRIIELANEKIELFYLILLRTESEGWIFSKKEINAKIINKEWSYSEKDYNYKIGNLMFDDHNYFTSHKQFLEKIK